MITYTKVRRVPSAFKSLTGLSIAQFDELYQDYEAACAKRRAASTIRADGKPRKYKAGGGSLFSHDGRTRLLMALMWLKVYPTYEVLGFFFTLHKSNAFRGVDDVLAVLETLASFAFERPTKERKQLHTVEDVMDLFPGVRLVIDAKEQRIQRPKGWENQKPYYSGKKKTHTLKTQIGVEPNGRIGAVSESFPGATHDITVLRRTGLVDRLDPVDEHAMMDKGYVGIRDDHPDHAIFLPFKATRGHPLTDIQKDANALLASYRIVVEHTNAQLSHFQVLSQTLRKARPKHTRIVRVVAALVNRKIHHKPLKSYAAA